MLKDKKKCPDRGPQTKMIKFPSEFSGHIKKLQSHKKQARMFKLCALSQVPNLSSPVAIIIITYLF